MVKYFRPISLIGIQYKVIATIFALHLEKNVGKLVSEEQTAFIKGCQILDGPLMLSEIVDRYKKKRKKLMIFKINFEKAYDSLSWEYLDFVMQRFGFGVNWRSWIHACLSVARASGW